MGTVGLSVLASAAFGMPAADDTVSVRVVQRVSTSTVPHGMALSYQNAGRTVNRLLTGQAGSLRVGASTVIRLRARGLRHCRCLFRWELAERRYPGVVKHTAAAGIRVAGGDVAAVTASHIRVSYDVRLIPSGNDQPVTAPAPGSVRISPLEALRLAERDEWFDDAQVDRTVGIVGGDTAFGGKSFAAWFVVADLATPSPAPGGPVYERLVVVVDGVSGVVRYSYPAM